MVVRPDELVEADSARGGEGVFLLLADATVQVVFVKLVLLSGRESQLEQNILQQLRVSQVSHASEDCRG